MEITLADLIALEPNLAPASAIDTVVCPLPDLTCMQVSWAVCARTTAPHLPALRGGEMLLIPVRVAAELGDNLSALVREARLRDVSAVVVEERTAPVQWACSEDCDLPVMVWRGELSYDAEIQINRRLTEWRGDLYRVGSELERQLAELAVNRAGIDAFVQTVAQVSGLPMSVYDAQGRLLVSDRSDSTAGFVEHESEAVLRRDLGSQGVLELGPLQAEQRITARFLVGRLAQAATAALQRDEAAKPRGSRRIEATAALLAGRRTGASDQRAAALALGLDPDAVYLVAISYGGSISAITRALAPLGEVHSAGGDNGRRTVLVAASERATGLGLAERVADIKKHWELEHANDGATLAFSAPAFGVASLPAATREAEFVSVLQAKSAFQKRAASFASVDDVGALRLLFHLRESSELRSFVADALGTLESKDQRGTLRATLRAFLESGGSQVDASHRLGIHRNTLAYRLRRIGEMVGQDIADPASWLTLHLALRASEMLDAYPREG